MSWFTASNEAFILVYSYCKEWILKLLLISVWGKSDLKYGVLFVKFKRTGNSVFTVLSVQRNGQFYLYIIDSFGDVQVLHTQSIYSGRKISVQYTPQKPVHCFI